MGLKVDYGGIYMPVTETATKDLNLYPVWTDIYCEVTFHVNGGTWDFDEGTYPFTPENGFSFESNGSEGKVVVKQVLKGREIGEIPYVKREDEKIADDDPDKEEKEKKRRNFILVGWFDKSLEGQRITRLTRVNEDIDVYAQWYVDPSFTDWKPTYCTVTFSGLEENATEGKNQNPRTVARGSNIEELPDKPGSTSSGSTSSGSTADSTSDDITNNLTEGWYERAEPNQYDKLWTADTSVNRDVTLYWAKPTKIAIKTSSSSGSGSGSGSGGVHIGPG